MMTIKDFLKANPQVAPVVRLTDEQLEIIGKIDLKKLSDTIQTSRFLLSRRSFNWLITNYDNIIAGAYGDWKRYTPAQPAKKTSRFKNSRTYSAKDFAPADIETADF